MYGFIIVIETILLICFLIWLCKQRDIVRQPEIIPVPVPVFEQQPMIQPEYRPPPVKRWKASDYQQMGLLTTSDGGIRPLYGRSSHTHPDRYFYYSTTPGDQIYPVSVVHNGRDCSEDIGCTEFYGNEQVTVFGSDNTYKVKLYPNKQFLS